jgi:hypothetical protein
VNIDVPLMTNGWMSKVNRTSTWNLTWSFSLTSNIHLPFTHHPLAGVTLRHAARCWRNAGDDRRRPHAWARTGSFEARTPPRTRHTGPSVSFTNESFQAVKDNDTDTVGDNDHPYFFGTTPSSFNLSNTALYPSHTSTSFFHPACFALSKLPTSFHVRDVAKSTKSHVA